MVKHLKGDSLRLAPTFLSNIRLGLEELAKDKHSSLLRKFVNYGRKKFYNTGPLSLRFQPNKPASLLNLV